MHRQTEDIVILIIAGTLSILFLSAILIVYIYYYQKRQNSFIDEKETLKKNFEKVLLESQIEVREDTMSGLGQELHDNIGQLLSSTKMLLGVTQRKLENVPATLFEADQSLSDAITQIRALSKSLSKDWLEKFNLIQNLKTEVARINAGGIMYIHLSHPEAIDLDSKKQIILFRIVQEALQNAVKHAEATNVHIVINTFGELMKLNIADDGKGFDIKNNAEGMGLTNMKQRTQLLGGSIDWKTSRFKGCDIEIAIPLKKLTS